MSGSESMTDWKSSRLFQVGQRLFFWFLVLWASLTVASAIAIEVAEGCHEGGWFQVDCHFHGVDVTPWVNLFVLGSTIGFFALPTAYLLFRWSVKYLYRTDYHKPRIRSQQRV